MDFREIEEKADSSKGLIRVEYRNTVLERESGNIMLENEKERFSKELLRRKEEGEFAKWLNQTHRYKIPFKIRLSSFINKIYKVFCGDKSE